MSPKGLAVAPGAEAGAGAAWSLQSARPPAQEHPQHHHQHHQQGRKPQHQHPRHLLYLLTRRWLAGAQGGAGAVRRGPKQGQGRAAGPVRDGTALLITTCWAELGCGCVWCRQGLVAHRREQSQTDSVSHSAEQESQPPASPCVWLSCRLACSIQQTTGRKRER